MPRLSVADCEALLRVIEAHQMPTSDSLRVAARLRRRLEQAVRSEASSGPSSARSPAPDHGEVRSCTLHVCTSCRSPGSPREPREHRLGFILHEKLCMALEDQPLQRRVEVRSAECLSVCPRPCGIALSSPGSWTYLFGDQHPGESVHDILECVSHYLEAIDGFMPRAERPKPLRASILGRVPPSRRDSDRVESGRI